MMIKTLGMPLLALLALLFSNLASAAGGDDEPAPMLLEPIEEVQGVIESQLLAFQASDGPGAFFHAAPGIQGAFGNAAQFMAMVEQGYNVIYENADWSFEDFTVQGARAAQIVLITDGKGREMRAMYFLRQMDGRWRIEGVQQIGNTAT